MKHKIITNTQRNEIIESENSSGIALVILKDLLFDEKNTNVWCEVGRQMDTILMEMGSPIRGKLMYYVNSPDFYSKFSNTDKASEWIGDLSPEKGKLLVSFLLTCYGCIWKGSVKKSLKWFNKIKDYNDDDIIKAIKDFYSSKNI